MRIDSHQHFWIYNLTDYVWMSDSMEVLQRDCLPSDLKPLLDDIGFEGSIAVQARQMERETEWLLELAAENDFIQGVVGWVDFASPTLPETLERFAANPKLMGVRELIHDMSDVDYATSNIHTRAIARLEPLGLTYDLLLRPQHLAPALALVRKFPNQRFVVDHIAKPDIAERQLEPWENGIRALAECDNVYCKLSGMVTEAVWRHWRAATFEPYLDIVVDAFGTDRLMIGSDWPVCTLSGDYRSTMDIVTDFAEAFSDDECDRILGGNAAEFYNLVLACAEARATLN